MLFSRSFRCRSTLLFGLDGISKGQSPTSAFRESLDMTRLVEHILQVRGRTARRKWFRDMTWQNTLEGMERKVNRRQRVKAHRGWSCRMYESVLSDSWSRRRLTQL